MLARKLRYVLDHRLLPGQCTATGHGVPRTFTRFEGFAVAVAATLPDAGLTRKVVTATLAVACDPVDSATPDSAALSAAFSACGGLLEIGYGRHLRLTVARRLGIQRAVDTGWWAIRLRAKPNVVANPAEQVIRTPTRSVSVTMPDKLERVRAVIEHRGRHLRQFAQPPRRAGLLPERRLAVEFVPPGG